MVLTQAGSQGHGIKILGSVQTPTSKIRAAPIRAKLHLMGRVSIEGLIPNCDLSWPVSVPCRQIDAKNPLRPQLRQFLVSCSSSRYRSIRLRGEGAKLGFRICYIASKASSDELAASLNVTIGDTGAGMPDSGWWIAKLKKNDWTILWSEDELFAQKSIAQIAELSRQHVTYICEVNETVMRSSAELWKDGQQLWKVTHTGDGDDIFDLSETGALPDGYLELKQKHMSDQKNDDEGVDHIFEIPLNLAALDFGFRHEDHLEQNEVESFHTIVAPRKKSFLARILGR